MNLGLHILLCPTGKYTYVGSVPAQLHRWVNPTKSDIMGQRTLTTRDGKTLAFRSLLFDTEKEAIDHAESLGYQVKT